MNIIFRTIKNMDEYDKIMELRYDVFVKEQNVPFHLEYDEFDKDAIHFGAFLNDKIVGCARLLTADNETVRFGRFAVKKDFRQQGIGFEFLKSVVDFIKSKGYKTIIIHAQLHAVSLYEKIGFVKIGNPFPEAGIMHVKMILNL